MKIVKVLTEKIFFSSDLRNFNEIFRKDVTYENIESHKKAWLQPLSRGCIFRKNTGGVKFISPSLYRANVSEEFSEIINR